MWNILRSMEQARSKVAMFRVQKGNVVFLEGWNEKWSYLEGSDYIKTNSQIVNCFYHHFILFLKSTSLNKLVFKVNVLKQRLRNICVKILNNNFLPSLEFIFLSLHIGIIPEVNLVSLLSSYSLNKSLGHNPFLTAELTLLLVYLRLLHIDS